MANSWKPQIEPFSQLIRILKDSISEDSVLRNEAMKHLEEAQKVPDFNKYLASIFMEADKSDISVRSAAGLLLKNNINMFFPQISDDVLIYLKEVSISGLSDTQQLIRNISGNLITTIIKKGGIMSSTEILPKLMQMLESPNISTQEGAFSAMTKICEDSSRELDQEYNGERPLNFMIPKFLSFTDSKNPRIRADAFFCLNQFILTRSQSLFAHIDIFLTKLFQSATDSTPEVRKNVCQALVMLLDVKSDKILPSFNSIVEYMLYCTSDSEEHVALEACEFWLAVAEQPELQRPLEQYLDRIVPTLLKGMVYSEASILTLEGDEDDAHIADKPEDIKPQHANAKIHENKHIYDNSSQKVPKLESDSDFDEDDYDYESDDEAYSQWNLRKCSAAAFDVLSTIYHNKLLEISMPYLRQNIFNEDWKIREAGVLALGALAEGCFDDMTEFLPELFPYLISLLNDPKPLIRQMTCWTLGRYSKWAAFLQSEKEKEKYFIALLEGLLRMVLDNNKKVQKAGCSALANLEEQAGPILIPYLDPILRTLVIAFQKYQQKNLLILYDALQTLTDSVGQSLNKKEYIDILMPPLIEKWSSLSDDDRDLFPLLECLSSVTVALGDGFMPFAPPVFSRCISIIHKTLLQLNLYNQDPRLDAPDKNFLVTSLDLLSGLVEGLGLNFEYLIMQAEPPLVQLLSICITDSSPEVRQSSYALLGDLSIFCFQHIKPYITPLMSELIGQLDLHHESFGICSNAAWSAGEISLKMGHEMLPYVNPLLDRLVKLLKGSNILPNVLENCAITIGRLSLACPDSVAPNLRNFIKPWCAALINVRDNEEKDSAFRGICTIISRNPEAITDILTDFMTAISKFQKPSPELDNMFLEILRGYKGMMNNWDNIISNLHPEDQQRLRERENKCYLYSKNIEAMTSYPYDYENVFDQDYLADDALIEDIWAQDEFTELHPENSDKIRVFPGEKQKNSNDQEASGSHIKKKNEDYLQEDFQTSLENLTESHVQYALGFDKNNLSGNSNKTSEAKTPQKNIKLFNDLPSAKQEALKTFEEHFYNIYHSKDLGESGQDEIMTCECKSEWDGTKNRACGKNSDCINRMTSVECTDDCNCGEDCQNRRFKLRQYSDIDVIKTKKKGYGIRANSDMESGQFVYEYVGEVIDEKKFRKRIKIYADEDIKHFYFMMLQRGEYIDATKKGGLARFLNHSCSPNCYVDKWVVGTKLHMGIFCKRNIQKGEELTFDYNVDRYGATAQPCYCEEPGCIGFIGGKTQTELHPKIPQNILEALGFDDLDFWDLSSKKIRKKKKDETDEEYYSTLQSNPINENGVTKIMSALLQCKERWIINRLLLRIHSNNDPVIQRRVMKMHGYQILGSVLRDWKEDFDISNMILNILLKWPRITKNKISSSKIETTVQILASHENAELRRMAQELIKEWGNLSMAYRIPKKPKAQQIEATHSEQENSSNDSKSYQSPDSQSSPISNEQYYRFSRFKNHDNYRISKSSSFRGERFWRPGVRFSEDLDTRGLKSRDSRTVDANSRALPPGWAVAKTQDGKPYYYCMDKVQWEFPLKALPPPPPPPLPPPSSFNSNSLDLQKIIDEANAELMERQNSISKHDSKNNKNNKNKDNKHLSSKKEKEKIPLEKILTKTFAKYVPNVIAKFQDELGKDEFKKRAKEIVEILVKKEMRPGHEIRNIYELSSTKKKKIKEFSRTYIEKVISKKKEKNSRKTTKSHKQENTNGFIENISNEYRSITSKDTQDNSNN
ncbi:hypothetical protein PORY_002312 [Pneumocystis oryctolagi]|uniref:Uncharacterized protein n=1 Tax=Pneumocystis oryctolagi TaxID=42067 RepID=A0ACB7C9G0_9ASCO|nr:hypothetical protein PORY_002312 [Pneumocystis oryctolagi]